MLEKSEKSKMIKYFVLTYLLFWLMLGITGLLFTLDLPVPVQNIIKNIDAWAPTIMLLIMFKYLYPNTTFKSYLKKNFTTKVNFKSFLMPLLMQLFITTLAITIFLLVSGTEFGSLKFISFAGLLPLLLITLTDGSTGEELGWRGYALNKFQEKYSPLKSTIIVGIIWGFWHAPLWFLSGYAGIELLYYIGAFLLAVISVSIIITFFYNKSKNILIAMWIHFLFNLSMGIGVVMIDVLDLLIYMAFTYFAFAVILVIVKKKEFLKFSNKPIEANKIIKQPNN